MLIDLLLTKRQHYTYEAYAAQQTKKVFEKWGISYRMIYLSDGGLSDYLSIVQDNQPNWTLGFSMLTPHCKPLCDVLRIPHFYWIEHLISPALNCIQSEFGRVGVHDPFINDRLSCSNLYFLPHGVNVGHVCVSNRTFDLVLFSDLVDLNFLQETWPRVLSDGQIDLVKRAIALENPFAAGEYMFYAEQYLEAYKTYNIMTKAAGKVRLDLFGNHAGNNWLLRLPDHVHLHASLPFSEYFEVLKTSKMILLDASNPWYYQAIALGCLPVVADQETITQYLMEPQKREEELNRLRATLPTRTWEMQINQLMGYMS